MKEAHLKNLHNNDPEISIFSHYIYVELPVYLRNSARCTVSDRLKTEPSRLACRACRDNVWFGGPAVISEAAAPHPGNGRD